MAELFKVIYKSRVRIFSVCLIAAGIIMAAVNGWTLMNFKLFGTTLDSLDVSSLHSGMCIKDELTYTYGDIRALITGRDTTYVYCIDVGKNHDMYMELLVSSKNGSHRELGDLMTYFPGYYKDLKSGKKVDLYAVVQKADKKTFDYEYFTNALNMTVDEMKEYVSTDYVIKMVDINDYKSGVAGGVLLVLSGAAVIFYIRWKRAHNN